MKMISLMITEEQHAALKAIRDKTGAPVSEVIRRAIAEYLSRANTTS